jgi:A/G-specific adenine glycosylase
MAYYRAHGRHTLPWRDTRNAYHILVSEMMLQQTQVDRVIPYYVQFIKKYPNARSLARAPLPDVLRMWSGLGYNRRARFLHEAGKKIACDGMPKHVENLETLPGVGPYTARAIAAFAYDERTVVIETNIRAAVIHHFFPNQQKVPDDALRPILAACVAGVASAREWYSALMDYGTHIKGVYGNPTRRSAHHAPQKKFQGSIRQVRGAILKARISGVPVEDIRAQFPEKFDAAHASLVRDGLLVE